MTRTIDGATARVPTLAEVVEKVQRALIWIGDDSSRARELLDEAIDDIRTIDGALADEAVTINRIRGQR